MKNKLNLRNGPVKTTIMRMAGGMVFGLLAMSAFNAVDTYFVGQLGTAKLAAMSFTFPVVMVLGSIALGLGVGLSSTVSRAIGAGDHHKVKRLTTDGLILALLIVVIISVFGIFTIRPLFTLLGAAGETLDLVQRYMFIWYLGVPFVVIPMAGNNVIRATGDTVMPSIIMIVSVVVNVILDPLLIFGLGPFPAMGISGAAIATVIARFSTLIFSLSILAFREKVIAFESHSISALLENWKEIAYVGVPAGAVQAIQPLSLGVITRILARFGDPVVAGFGAAGRIEMLIMILPMTLGMVMAPFAGQNWGAGKVERIREGFRFSSIVSLVWGGIIFAASLLLAHSVLSLFNTNPEIVRAGATYLRIMGIGYGFFGLVMISSQCLSAINSPLESGSIVLTKAFFINVPLAFAGAALWHESGVFAASLIANVCGGILGFILLSVVLNRKIKNSVKFAVDAV